MDNKLKYYLSKVERQLDFHKGLHLFEMEMNSSFSNKVVFLKESQEEYITNLFGEDKNIRENYEKEFGSNIIVESTFNHKDEVERFFSFVKENFNNVIKKSSVINEQKKPFSFTDIANTIKSKAQEAAKKRNDALAKMTPEQKTAFLKKEAEIKAKTDKTANSVIVGLKKAFDTDNDNVFDDYDGTYEDQAVKAINLITNRNILDRVNQLIAASIKPYKDLRGWVNAEMSDFDPTEYRAMWKRLESLGYKGANYNDFLAAAGIGVDYAYKGFKWLKDKGLPWFFEKLRDALGSTVGAILQQLLDYTGIGAVAVSILWAVLTLFDVSQIASGIGSWAKLFFSMVGLLTAGALAKTIGGFLKPFFNTTGGTIGKFFASIAEKPWFVKYVKPVVSWIGSKLSGAASLLKQAGTWVAEKLGATTIGGYVAKAAKWMEGMFESLVKWAGTGAQSETKLATKIGIKKLGADEIKKDAKKIADKAVYDKFKEYGQEKVINTAGYLGGEKGKKTAELYYGAKDLKKTTADLGKAIQKGDIAKTAEKTYKTYDKFGKVVDKGAQLASNGKVTTPVKNNVSNATKYAANKLTKQPTNWYTQGRA